MPLNSRSRREADLGLKADVLLDGIGLDVGGAHVVSFLVVGRTGASWKGPRCAMESLPKADLIGLLAVMRFDAANREIEDYVLLPAPLRSGRYVWLSSDSLRRHRGALYQEKGALFGAIKARLAKTNRAAPTSSAPSKKRSKSGRPKAKGFGGRRSRCGDTRPLR
jgi:hypothetical protein